MDLYNCFTQCLSILFLSYVTALDSTLAEVERHLELGKDFLSRGQFADALTHFNAAVDYDGENYQALYRRATLNLAIARSKAALPDLNKVLELKPDFIAARMHRAKLLFKQGDLIDAQFDYESVLEEDPRNQEAARELRRVPNVVNAVMAADMFFARKDYQKAILNLNIAIEGYVHFDENLRHADVQNCPWDPQLCQRRSKCYEELGQLANAINDVRALTKIVADSTEVYYQLSLLYYRQGDSNESLKQIRECLKLNPDHAEGFKHYKHVKKVNKAMIELKTVVEHEIWDDCIKKAMKAIDVETQNPEITLQVEIYLCKCYMKAGHYGDAIDTCTDVLETEQQKNVQVLCDRAEAYLSHGDFEEALEDYNKALEIDGGLRRAKHGKERTLKLIKQSKKRDYYKILGVRRNANKKTILKAYRKLAQKWHPDHYQDDEEKKAAEAKFIDIAAAKEVLSDPKMRRQFDGGSDPLDAEETHQRKRNPWHRGGGGGHQWYYEDDQEEDWGFGDFFWN